MSYRLRSQEKLSTGIKRLARELADDALDYLREPQADPDEAIHEARKCFKKIRSVLRLVRDEVGEEVYKQENLCYRDAGRRLSEARDSRVMVQTLTNIRKRFVDPLDGRAFAQLHQALIRAHQTALEAVFQANVFEQLVDTLEEAQPRIEDWPIANEDFSVLAGGLHRVYKRGYKHMAEAYADPRPEAFHEWRKRAKYLRNHIRMLRFLWPALLEPLATEMHDLTNILGEDHDLATLHQRASDSPEMFKDKDEQQLLLALICQQRARLETAAQPLGQRIYTEKPKHFVRRIGAYWPANNMSEF